MTVDQIQEQISRLLAEIMISKGEKQPSVMRDTLLLGGALNIDSLDLAAIVVSLSEQCDKDPFSEGFVEFRTVGELAQLYTD